MKNSGQRIWGIVVRHLFSWPRNVENIAETFWWPTFDILTWGLTTEYLRQTQGLPARFVSFLVGGVLLWLIVYRSQQEMGLAFLWEVWERNLLNILVTPLSIWEFLTATLILGSIKLIASAAWLTLLAFVLFKFNIFQLGWSLVPYILLLLLTGWSAGFVINGIVVRFGQRIQSFTWTLILILYPFSAVFYPLSVLPSWMQVVARFVPTSYVFEGMRRILSGQTVNTSFITIACFLNVIYLLLSLLFFRRCFRKAQEEGMIVKFSNS